MAQSKRIICLANSRKLTGRCLAGKEFDGSKIGPWIRPVSSRPTGELSEDERRFENGQDPAILQIIRVPILNACPHGYQTENYLIDENFYWADEGKATSNDVEKALDSVAGPLWDNSAGSSYNGICDKVAEETASKLSDSLKLIRVKDLSIEVSVEGAAFGNSRRKVRGHFSLNGQQYKLAVTDPLIERKYLAGPNGTFQIGNAFLCISLGEPYGGFAWKLIATVIPI